MICVNDAVNTNNCKTVGTTILKFLDGGIFMDKVSLKLKCKNFDFKEENNYQ